LLSLFVEKKEKFRNTKQKTKKQNNKNKEKSKGYRKQKAQYISSNAK